MNAERVQIWTDVDGILTADPRMVKDVRKISRMSFEEAFDLSYFGAKVLHPNTSEYRIAFTVAGAYESSTVIPRLEEFGQVTVFPDKASLCIVGSGLRESPGFAGRVFSALTGVKTSLIAHGASGLSMTVVVDRGALEGALVRLHAEFFGSSAPVGEFDVPFN